MKTNKLLLFLLVFLPICMCAMPQGKVEDIKLQKSLSSTPAKGKRSVDLLEVSAHFNFYNETLLINLYGDFKNVEISVTNLLTNEVVYSELHTISISSNIVLNMGGLLEENSEYRLEIIIGETILYGDFDF